jgi:hypothetical protein
MPAMTKKPDLDEATMRIARTLLNTPPKPHEQMKLGKVKKKATRRKAKKSGR